MASRRVGRSSHDSPVSSIESTRSYEALDQCKCGLIAKLWTSWSDNNPGRRFRGCPNYQNDSYCGFFAWLDPEIRGRAKVALLEKRDEARDLKAEVKRLSAILGRYKEESSGLKEQVAELKGETIGLLEEAENLKIEAANIKDEVSRLKAECAELKRKLAKHASREKLYVIAIMFLFLLLTIVVM